MKLIVAVCLFAVAAAAPPTITRVDYPTNDVRLLVFENENVGEGQSYRYNYQQSDGTGQEQEGRVINEGQEDESIVVRGSYTWVGPDGVTYRVTYTADDDGFKPEIEQGPGGGVPPAVIATLLG